MKSIQKPNQLLSYFKAEKKVLGIITLSGICYNVGMSVGPFFEGLLVQMLYDITTQHQTIQDMIVLALLYVFMIFLVQLSRSIKRFYVRRFANNVSRTMRHTLYHQLVHLPYVTMKKSDVGELMTKAISDVDACVEGMRKFTTEIFDTGVVLIVYVSVMLYYDWRLTLLSCSFIPLAYAIANGLKKKITTYHRQYKQSVASFNQATFDQIEHILTYRIHGCVENRSQAYEAHLNDVEEKAFQANVWETSMKPIYHMISMTGVIFLLFFGAKNVLGTGHVAWNLAAFTTYLSCFTKMAVKSSSAAKLMNAIQKAQVSWKRIQPLMIESPSIEQSAIQLSPEWKLEVKHLCASYDTHPIVKDVNFVAHPGEIIGVSGTIASGKSTFGKAFLFEPHVEGEILVDGHDCATCSIQQRHALFGYMGHQSELLHDTVLHNITLGKKEAIQSVVELVGLADELSPSTNIGEQGSQISGGQQARLSLARTLYHEKPILILDDPFASVDLESETKMIQEIRKTCSHQIVLLISHRITHFADFDQVIWFERGHAQVTTHQQMMLNNPTYADIFRKQGGGTDEE